MPDDSLFLNRIIAEPDDDLPRLIYADWLEEQGHPRAEFIRVQCELARLEPGDERYTELKIRERVLLEMHQHEWVDEEIEAVGESVNFRRGFPEAFAMSTTQVEEQLIRIARRTPVSSLVLTTIDSNWDNLRLLPPLPQIRFLGLQSFPVSRPELLADLPDFPVWHQLTEIDLMTLRLRRDLFSTMRNWSFPQLTGLRLNMNEVVYRDEMPHQQMDWMEQLRSLWLYQGREISQMLYSPRLHQLRSLHILQVPQGNAYAFRALTDSEGLSSLRELVLDGYKTLHADRLEPLADSSALQGLRHLRLRGCGFDSDEIKSLCQTPKLGELRWLNLQGSGLTRLSASQLARSPSLHRLNRLVLGNNRIGNSGFQELVECEHLQELRALDVSANLITNPGLLALAENATRFPQLISLNLSGNQLTTAALQALADSHLGGQLQRLEISVRDLSERGYECLLDRDNFPRLQTLGVHKGSCPVRYLNRLQARFQGQLW